MRIEELMTENPTCCTPDTSVHDVAEIIAESDCGAVPVVENTGRRRVIGVVTDRDIVVRAVARRKPINHISVREIMTETPVTVVSDGDAEDVREAMGANQVRFVLVCDDKGCVGIVAQADLACHLPPEQAAEMLRRVSQPRAAASEASNVPPEPPAAA